MTILVKTNTDPNQKITIEVENTSYILNIRSSSDGNLIYFSINRNSEVIITNQRAMPNQNALLFEFQFNNFGNFIFTTSDNNYPSAANLGTTTLLSYITKEEVADG